MIDGVGEGVRWLDLDEDISVVGLISGRRGKANDRSSSGSKRCVQPAASDPAIGILYSSGGIASGSTFNRSSSVRTFARM